MGWTWDQPRPGGRGDRRVIGHCRRLTNTTVVALVMSPHLSSQCYETNKRRLAAICPPSHSASLCSIGRLWSNVTDPEVARAIDDETGSDSHSIVANFLCSKKPSSLTRPALPGLCMHDRTG